MSDEIEAAAEAVFGPMMNLLRAQVRAEHGMSEEAALNLIDTFENAIRAAAEVEE